MTRISKIIIGIFLGLVATSAIIAFDRYIIQKDYVVFTSENDIPDPFIFLN